MWFVVAIALKIWAYTRLSNTGSDQQAACEPTERGRIGEH